VIDGSEVKVGRLNLGEPGSGGGASVQAAEDKSRQAFATDEASSGGLSTITIYGARWPRGLAPGITNR
jgi:hypothetical protein